MLEPFLVEISTVNTTACQKKNALVMPIITTVTFRPFDGLFVE